jgi:hypothetical protein
MSCDRRCGSDEEMACHDCPGVDNGSRTSNTEVATPSASDNTTKVETVTPPCKHLISRIALNGKRYCACCNVETA